MHNPARIMTLMDQFVGRAERISMLPPYVLPVFSDLDEVVFDALVRRDHYLRRVDKHIDFVALRQSIERFYGDSGRPATEPVLMLKLEFLQFHDNLSDSQVFQRAETDLAYRWFLGLGRDDYLPDRKTLVEFRARLGTEGHTSVFQALVGQARNHGLVRDRLRIKDATHVIADIAVPAGLTLLAQARNRLLAAAEPFAPDWVAGEHVRIETIRASTEGRADAERLVARVAHLRDILAWAEELAAPAAAASNPTWQRLVQAREVARKVLAGHDAPKAGDKLRSTVDPDARRGRHGEFYDGYFVDVLIDADSELFTAIHVLPASGNESADALELIAQEQQAHGNHIEQLSIDGAGYDGPVLRELEDADGPNIDVFVPPKAPTHAGLFGPVEFQENEESTAVTCPAGKTSRYRQRGESRHCTTYRFTAATCAACPLQKRCMEKPPEKFGRSVRKNDYEPEYDRVRERARTNAYAEVKREHPKVERKLGELMNRHGCRRARYRGRGRVLIQQSLGAVAANVKRMVSLLDGRTAQPALS